MVGKTKVVGLVEMSRLVQAHQRASHVLPPSPTALCERLWARTLMTTRYLPAVDVQGFITLVARPFTDYSRFGGIEKPSCLENRGWAFAPAVYGCLRCLRCYIQGTYKLVLMLTRHTLLARLVTIPTHGPVELLPRPRWGCNKLGTFA